jgi:hypothetical protein
VCASQALGVALVDSEPALDPSDTDQIAPEPPPPPPPPKPPPPPMSKVGDSAAAVATAATDGLQKALLPLRPFRWKPLKLPSGEATAQCVFAAAAASGAEGGGAVASLVSEEEMVSVFSERLQGPSAYRKDKADDGSGKKEVRLPLTGDASGTRQAAGVEPGRDLRHVTASLRCLVFERALRSRTV